MKLQDWRRQPVADWHIARKQKSGPRRRSSRPEALPESAMIAVSPVLHEILSANLMCDCACCARAGKGI
jgi:hypothetical protein